MAQGFDFFAGSIHLFDFGYFFGGGFVGFAVFSLGLLFFGGGNGFFDGIVVVFGNDDFVLFTCLFVDVVGADGVVAFGIAVSECILVAAVAGMRISFGVPAWTVTVSQSGRRISSLR